MRQRKQPKHCAAALRRVPVDEPSRGLSTFPSLAFPTRRHSSPLRVRIRKHRPNPADSQGRDTCPRYLPSVRATLIPQLRKPSRPCLSLQQSDTSVFGTWSRRQEKSNCSAGAPERVSTLVVRCQRKTTTDSTRTGAASPAIALSTNRPVLCPPRRPTLLHSDISHPLFDRHASIITTA